MVMRGATNLYLKKFYLALPIDTLIIFIDFIKCFKKKFKG